MEGSVSLEQYKDFPMYVLIFRNKAKQMKCVKSVFKKLSKVKIVGQHKEVLIV